MAEIHRVDDQSRKSAIVALILVLIGGVVLWMVFEESTISPPGGTIVRDRGVLSGQAAADLSSVGSSLGTIPVAANAID